MSNNQKKKDDGQSASASQGDKQESEDKRASLDNNGWHTKGCDGLVDRRNGPHEGWYTGGYSMTRTSRFIYTIAENSPNGGHSKPDADCPMTES